MAKDLNLLGYLPPFLQEYRELQEIFLTDEVMLSQTLTSIDQLLQNQFISHCDEIGIAFFENMLKIYPYSTDDLDTRITRVLLKWNDYPPYTLKYLINVLDNLFASENYQFNDDFLNYAFSINFTNNFLPSDLESFYKFIGNIKPANLCFNVTANSTISNEVFCGVKVAGKYVNSRFIVNDFSQTLTTFDTFYSPIIASNYLKEVFTFE